MLTQNTTEPSGRLRGRVCQLSSCSGASTRSIMSLCSLCPPPESPRLPQTRHEAQCGGRGQTRPGVLSRGAGTDGWWAWAQWCRPPEEPAGPTRILGEGFPAEPMGNLHNILCKFISASDNDLGVAGALRRLLQH